MEPNSFITANLDESKLTQSSQKNPSRSEQGQIQIQAKTGSRANQSL